MRIFFLTLFFLVNISCEQIEPINLNNLNARNEEQKIDDYCALGASTAAMGWQKEVAKNLNVKTYKNYAIGGTRWSHTSLSSINLTSNAGDNAHNKVMTNQLARILLDKQENNYSPDVITIMCGLNDAANGPGIIGNFEESFSIDLSNVSYREWFNEIKFKKYRETVIGTTRFVIDQLKTNFPNAKIFIITPQQVDNGTYNNENVRRVNEAVIKIANKYDVVVIDVFNESGIIVLKDVSTIYLQADRIHPSSEGEKLLTKYVTEQLRIYLN